MEPEKSLVKQEPPQSFIERLIEHAEDLEKVKEVGMVIINSGFCPEHFKQSKDAVGAIMCIEAGRKLGLTWMQALSDIYPVKGRIGIMGSAARAVIFGCGLLDKWEEITEGTYPEENYKHIIISKRKDLPGMFRSEFSVYDAKKAGLFGKDIYQRYGKRMIMWRNIGFHANDYYGDIMKGMKTVEELNDFDVIPGVGNTTIEKEDGTKINIQGGAPQKSKKMTDRVADKIPDNKFGEVKKDGIQDAVIITREEEGQKVIANLPTKVYDESYKDFIIRYNKYIAEFSEKFPELNLIPMKEEDESPFKAGKGSAEYMNGVLIIRDENTGDILNMDEIDAAGGNKEPLKPGQLTLKEMEEMDTKVLLQMVNDDMDMMEACQTIGGKNTNKKLREIIFAHQNNKLAEFVAPYLKAGDQITPAPASDAIPPNKDFDSQGGSDNSQGAIQDFLDPKKEVKKPVDAGNKYNLVVPEYNKGNQREFGTTKDLFNKMMGLTPQITTPRYMELAGKLNFLEKYKDKEIFCRDASVAEINLLLNEN